MAPWAVTLIAKGAYKGPSYLVSEREAIKVVPGRELSDDRLLMPDGSSVSLG